MFISVAGSDRMLVHTDIIYLLNMADLHVLGLLICLPPHPFLLSHVEFPVATFQRLLERHMPMMNVSHYFLFLLSARWNLVFRLIYPF